MFIRNENFKQFISFYPIVATIIGVNIFVFLLTLLPILGDEIYFGGMHINAYITNGEIWRAFTSMFLHAGFLHLLFNMFSLYLFGPELEKIAGKVRFLTIYLFAGIGGSIATYLIHSPSYASVGASGAVFGIFGAYAAILVRHRKTTPHLRQVILPIIVISVILTFLQSNVNAAGHIGGLIVGFLFGMFYFSNKNFMRWRN